MGRVSPDSEQYLDSTLNINFPERLFSALDERLDFEFYCDQLNIQLAAAAELINSPFVRLCSCSCPRHAEITVALHPFRLPTQHVLHRGPLAGI